MKQHKIMEDRQKTVLIHTDSQVTLDSTMNIIINVHNTINADKPKDFSPSAWRWEAIENKRLKMTAVIVVPWLAASLVWRKTPLRPWERLEVDQMSN